MIIRTLITLVLALPAFWLTMRYNMHMFQLNTYMNNEQRAWLARNRHLQWILRFAEVLGIARICLPKSWYGWADIVLDVLIWLTLTVIILVYRLMVEMNSKKPLKFTPRVRRMVGTIIFLCLLFIGAVCLISYMLGAMDGALRMMSGVLVLLVGCQIGMEMIANTVNKPIELNINNGYIRDAKRILRQNPDLKIIGVTGSYGKTSVKFYLETLLKQRYSTLVTPESYNTPMGIVITIRKFLKPTHEVFVCEMGARYVGEIKEDCDLVHPHHGLITSIGPQHLDTFESMANIQKTKFELADAVPDGGMLFLNGDNEYIKEELERRRGTRPLYDDPVMYYSDGTESGYYASDVAVTNHGTDFTVNAPDGESARFSMKLVGGHNVINVMGAIAVAHELGISLADLRIPVRRIQSVPHRMEMKNHGDVTIIDDAFNSNPIGSKAAVETLAMMDGMRILITPGMVELGEDEAEYNRKFGTYAAACCDRIFLVGAAHTKPIKEGILSEGFPEDHIEIFDKVEDAINRAYAVRTKEHKYILLENDLPDNY
jgi:UDP-N-acetylmuramoyl-tripeptide--D-alanyl-D-alanine ligase